MLRFGIAAIGAVSLCGLALAQDSVQEREFWAAAFETGRSYAADMTLISYCLRGDPDLATFVPISLVGDLHSVTDLARTGAVDRRRMAEFLREVLTSVRFASRDAADPSLDKQCAERKVADEVLRLGPVARPLTMRPPFARH